MTFEHVFHLTTRAITIILDEVFPKPADICALERIPIEDWRAHALTIRFHETHPWCMSILPFAEPAVRLAIHQVKFNRNIRMATLLAHLLDDASRSFFEYDNTQRITSADTAAKLIIPIPISWIRMHERGYNQAELIASQCAVPRHYGWQLNTHILCKRYRKSQTRCANETERAHNAARAFYIHTKAPSIKNADIILVDDVITSGSTLAAARDVLLQAGARSVQALTVASGK